MNWGELVYILTFLAVFILCGWWLRTKGRSLWYLLLLPVLGVFALIIYALLKNKKQQPRYPAVKNRRKDGE